MGTWTWYGDEGSTGRREKTSHYPKKEACNKFSQHFFAHTMEEDNVKLDEEEETAEDVGLEPPVDEGFTETQVTVRALLVGGLAGVIVAVSNIYIGLKIGWSFGASQFAALLAFAILKPLSKYLNMPWGGYFGPKENCSAQTCGTAASMLSAGFTYAIPAL